MFHCRSSTPCIILKKLSGYPLVFTSRNSITTHSTEATITSNVLYETERNSRKRLIRYGMTGINNLFLNAQNMENMFPYVFLIIKLCCLFLFFWLHYNVPLFFFPFSYAHFLNLFLFNNLYLTEIELKLHQL